MDEAFREQAGDDAVASISFLMGALDGLRVRPRVLSYEGPFGVGYMVAAIDILEDEGGEVYAEAERAQVEPPQPEPPQPEPESIVAAAGSSHPLARLARDAAEKQVAIARSKAMIEPHEPVSLWRFEVRRLT